MKRPAPDPVRPGQESVWSYPRPPRLERSSREIRVVFADVVIARTRQAWRVLETSSPPVYYLPQSDVRMDCLYPTAGSSVCEWKGTAAYWDVRIGELASRLAAWSYAQPKAPYAAIADHLAFYPARVDACYVDDELVRPQEGDFYGGWITGDIAGPFKGPPGTENW